VSAVGTIGLMNVTGDPSAAVESEIRGMIVGNLNTAGLSKPLRPGPGADLGASTWRPNAVKGPKSMIAVSHLVSRGGS
jgi:hypothetical protein